jgi:hypothetical protein
VHSLSLPLSLPLSPPSPPPNTPLVCTQGDTTKYIVELESQAQSLRDKLSAYQQLEYELDVAVISAGVTEAEATAGGAVKGIDTILASVGGSVPAANKRRIQQSILLAQKLLERQRAVEALGRDKAELQEQVAHLTAECHELQRQLDRIEQPHSYLLAAMRAKDTELSDAAAAVKALKHDLQASHERAVLLAADKQALAAQLAAAERQRVSLDAVRELVLRLKGAQQQAQQGQQGQQAAVQAQSLLERLRGLLAPAGSEQPAGSGEDAVAAAGAGQVATAPGHPPSWLDKLRRS